MKRYQIWNKTDQIYTHAGEVLSPDEWISRYGWINHPRAVPVVSGGLINGGCCRELSEMKSSAERYGAVFPEDLSNEELLDAIEEWEDEINRPADSQEVIITPEERTAAALEFIAMNSLPDNV